MIQGRGTGSEIRINDISVSREHAHMILKDKRVFLKDLNSKFGTLALVRNPIPFSQVWNKVSIQIGKTVLELKLTSHSSLFSCTYTIINFFSSICNSLSLSQKMRLSFIIYFCLFCLNCCYLSSSQQPDNLNNYYYKHENEDFEQIRESARKLCPQPPNILQPQQYGAKKSSDDKDAFNYNVN